MAADFTPTPPAPIAEEPPSYVVSGITLLIRAALLIVAGWLNKEGLANHDQGAALVQWGVGDAAGLAAIAWSFVEKHVKIQQINALRGLLGMKT